MSSFNCPSCGTPIIDTELGYITSCEHYPIEDIVIVVKDGKAEVTSKPEAVKDISIVIVNLDRHATIRY